MNELLERASTNQYGNTGTKPLLGSTLMQADQGVTPPYSIDHPESSDFPEMEKQKSSTPDSLEANQKDKNEESDGKDMKGEGNLLYILISFLLAYKTEFERSRFF